MSPETAEHNQIKEIVSVILKKQYGVSLSEYPDSGNIHDGKAVTSDGISIFVENVWTSSRSNFQRDLNILHRSKDDVKVFIVNPKILQNNSLKREFEKTAITKREKGFQVSPLIDSSRILNDHDYANNDFCRIIEELVTEARKRRAHKKNMRTNTPSLLKHSKQIIITRSDYQGLDCWAKATLLENLLRYGNDKLETKSILQHLETGYHDEFWVPFMEYKGLLEKYNYPIVPFPPRFQEEIGGYGKSLSEHFESIPDIDKKRMLELKQRLLSIIERIIFGVENGIPLKGQCDFCPHDVNI